MIIGYIDLWLPYLQDIDIKSYEWPWTNDDWKNEAKKYIVKIYLKKENKSPQGFVVYRFVPIKNLMENEEGTVVHILKLAIHPNWRNRGIGTKLLKNVEVAARLQDVDRLIIILHEENEGGREWLIRKDFKGVKVHRKLFPDNRDGFSFLKKI